MAPVVEARPRSDLRASVWRYRAHDLTIASNAPIPQLIEIPDAGEADVHVRFHEDSRDAGDPLDDLWFVSPYRTDAGAPSLVATAARDGRCRRLTYADGITFDFDAGATGIDVRTAPGVSRADALDYLLGPVLGLVLRVRDVFCLHGSAVEVGTSACVFVGPPGAGKSTTAAAMARAGFAFLADDVVALTRVASAWMVSPAYPRVRLWSDVLPELGLRHAPERQAAGESGTRIHVDVRAGGQFAHAGRPLAVIYAIDFDDDLRDPCIDRLSPSQAWPLLATNTFAHRALDRGGRGREFQTLADILSVVPVRRLRRPVDLRRLSHVCHLVASDAATGFGANGRHVAD